MFPKRDITDRMIRPTHVVRRKAAKSFVAGCLRRGCALAAKRGCDAPELSAKLREPATGQSADAGKPENPDTYAK